MPADVVALVGEMVDLIGHREYLKANDAYLRMAIGNAAWPMGVTMVWQNKAKKQQKKKQTKNLKQKTTNER